MKKANKILIIALALSMANPAHARVVERADSIADTRITAVWHEIKVVAVKTWHDLRNQFLGDSEVSSEPKKAPAVMAQTPTENVEAPKEEAQLPNSQLAPDPALIAASAQVVAPQIEVQNQGQTQLAEIIKQTRATVSNKSPVQVSSPGRAGTSVLPKTKIGVPTFALTKKETKKTKSGKKKTISIAVTKIPKLDIGLEKSISKNDFMPTELSVDFNVNKKLSALESPKLHSNKEIAKITTQKLPLVDKAKMPTKNGVELGSMVSLKRIQDVPLDMLETKVLEQLKPYSEVTNDDLGMITAVILLEKKDKCHLASGLLSLLAEKKKYSEEANFYLGVCAHQMGFHSEAVSRLVKVVVSEHAEYVPDAITNLVEDLPREYDAKVATAIKGLKNTNLIPAAAKDNMNFVLARAAHEKSSYAEATKYAAKVSESSKRYRDARYIYGIALYAQKKLKESEMALLALRDWMVKKNKGDKNIEALIAVNLARMRFTQARYQAAHDEYMKVPKDHPLWVQALVEQGWAQLSVDDAEGAIGNMYSLHSPYFKSVFTPESWVVRTIGYIDICQYGDAYKTLTKLEQLHGGWKSSVDRYRTSKKKPLEYYDTVKNYIRGRSDQDIDGLPHQVIREIARQRGFLNAQGAINVLEDEIAQYAHIYRLIKKDQLDLVAKVEASKKRLVKINEDLNKIKTNPDLVKFKNEWNAQKRNEERLVRSYNYQKVVYEVARKGFVGLKNKAFARIESDKGNFRTLAGKELMSHLKDIQTRIGNIVEGNEFLRYEIFSGSGENIRYQVSGGTTADAKRIPANIKPQKILNWEFDGEYWEDEIGSYRSTLKNNCPKNARAAQVYDRGLKTTAKNEK